MDDQTCLDSICRATFARLNSLISFYSRFGWLLLQIQPSPSHPSYQYFGSSLRLRHTFVQDLKESLSCIYRNTLSVLPSFDELCDRNPRLSIIKRKNNENKTKNSVQQRTCVCKVLDSISLYRLRRTPFGT